MSDKEYILPEEKEIELTKIVGNYETLQKWKSNITFKTYKHIWDIIFLNTNTFSVKPS